MADRTGVPEELSEALTGALSGIIGALLVAGRRGAPAEGRLPFNPLYFHMLRRLSAAPSRPSAIADGLGVSRTTVSTAARALEARGLVARASDPGDARAVLLRLTEEGEEVVGAILRQDRRNAEAMLGLLAPEDRAAFVRAARLISEGLSDPARAP